MTEGRTRFLRDNLFLVASVLLPLVVVLFFAAANAVPRWTVPDPRYDALVRARGPYTSTNRWLSVDFSVRDGQVEASVRVLPATAYIEAPRLLLIDHTTMGAREIPVNVPADMREGDPARTIVVDALAGRHVVADLTAPDGYRVEARSQRGPGLMGELFGMNRYGMDAALVNKGRVVGINLPAPYEYQSPVTFVGWIVDEAR